MKLDKHLMAFYKTWLTIFVLDAILNVVVYTFLIGEFYKSELSKIGLNRIDRDKPILEIQLIVYAVLVAILSFFILKSLPKKNRKSTGALYGILMGVIIFITHNLLNFALLKDWTAALVIIDGSWGILQGAMIGFLTAYLYDRFNA